MKLIILAFAVSLMMATNLVAQPSGMAFIPAGSFVMGDSLGDSGTNSAELPVHTVYVSAFYMDQTLVTKINWDAVYQWAVANGYNFNYPGSGKAASHPVQRIDWYDAVKWCNARSEREGLTPCYYTDATHNMVYRSGQIDLGNNFVNWSANGYRLPTEAEWEKAARGGLNGHRFPWGDTISETQANYYSGGGYGYDLSNTGYNPTFNDGISPYTSPAATFASNGHGLYDMSGNSGEWCWDWYGGSWYGNAQASQNDTHGPDKSVNLRVMRGGNWALDANYARSAFRNNYYPYPLNSGWDWGFRCVSLGGQNESLDNGLVAYYPFNGNANDQSGNGYNGIVNGAIPSRDRFGNAIGSAP